MRTGQASSAVADAVSRVGVSFEGSMGHDMPSQRLILFRQEVHVRPVNSVRPISIEPITIYFVALADNVQRRTVVFVLDRFVERSD